MRIFRLATIAAAAVAASLGAFAQVNNQPTKACGTWNFSGTPHTFGGVLAELKFNFTPTQQKCGVDPCVCQNIAYIQVIRVRDMDKGIYIQPFQAQASRMTVSDVPELNGWAVDRLTSNSDLGYFAGISLDPIQFGSDVTVGTNSSSPKVRAELSDQPVRYPRRARFEAVTVPVCLDTGGACGGKLLGFRTWKFRVQDNEAGTDPTHAASKHWERDAVLLAIEKWNQKVGSQLEPFPDGTAPLSME